MVKDALSFLHSFPRRAAQAEHIGIEQGLERGGDDVGRNADRHPAGF